MKRCDDDWFRVLRTYNRYIILITVLLECINLYIYIYTLLYSRDKFDRDARDRSIRSIGFLTEKVVNENLNSSIRIYSKLIRIILPVCGEDCSAR